jgi:4-hydroxythreonine-4-phosphate dehydrogenase
MSINARPRIGLLAGDPTGIGPEIAAKLLAEPETHEAANIVLIGDPTMFPPKHKLPILEVPLVSHPPLAYVSKEAGAFTLATLRRAAEAIKDGEIDALVYAPLNKQAMKLAGLYQEDEMHYLAYELAFDGLCSEINVAANLWTTRVTSHVPLRQVADLIDEPGVYNAIGLLDRIMRASSETPPRIAVAGLNPHAGEGGLLGYEEIRVIGPAVERAKADGIDVSGPYPADTLFIAARRGDFHAVVTMYHDQGQIAMKLMGFEKGVTLHGGMPKPIATPAHGTAFDIAGQGIANVGPIREAFRLVSRLAAIS